MDTAVATELLTLNINRVFKASREAVFDAWTQPQALVEWFAPDPAMTTKVDKLELKTGGKYQFQMIEPNGDTFIITGEYLTISRPDQLIFTWQWTHDDCPVMLITLDFIEQGASTEMRLLHEKLPDTALRDHHNEGWTGCFVRLEEYLTQDGSS